MRSMARPVVVIGGGIGGLAAALRLVARGVPVLILERGAAPGGKLRTQAPDGRPIDAGPTVLTMLWVFEELFDAAGATLSDHVSLEPAEILARHAWPDGARLDLFANAERSADAIGNTFGAAEAQGFRSFAARARRTYEALEHSFIRSGRPSPVSLVRGAGLRGLPALLRISPFETLWGALGTHFRDPRLRQLFGRYATYCGSSPFLAPATLMLVAHVEQQGVWRVQGGMHRLAAALAELAQAHGALLRTAAEVAEIVVQQGRARAVRLIGGEIIEAAAIILNGDSAALAAGCFGADARGASAVVAPAQRSLSAITWAMPAQAQGFPLVRHTVFFSDNYAAEFDALFKRRTVPEAPTVYVCAQDRADADDASAAERLLCLVNAPPTGDGPPTGDMDAAAEIETCTARMTATLQRCGLRLTPTAPPAITSPREFSGLFPGTGGALYGRAVHGPLATFRRPEARSALPGLYLAGGSTHPGAGLPMAALSGRLAAEAVLADWASLARSHRAAMPGGMSTR
jgi:1-hydroxycarotenoid 3,4-desaturase